MKAWLVRDKEERYCATVVFAETRGKAKVVAQSTDACEDIDFCGIEAKRLPQIDKYYAEGKREMNWFKFEDRIALVREAGFSCDPNYWEPDDCGRCPASEWCDMAKEREEG